MVTIGSHCMADPRVPFRRTVGAVLVAACFAAYPAYAKPRHHDDTPYPHGDDPSALTDLVLDPDSGDPIPIIIDPDNPPTVQIDSGDVITPPIRGEVQEIVIEVDEDGTVTVLVTLMDESGQIQTVRVSL